MGSFIRHNHSPKTSYAAFINSCLSLHFKPFLKRYSLSEWISITPLLCQWYRLCYFDIAVWLYASTYCSSLIVVSENPIFFLKMSTPAHFYHSRTAWRSTDLQSNLKTTVAKTIIGSLPTRVLIKTMDNKAQSNRHILLYNLLQRNKLKNTREFLVDSTLTGVLFHINVTQSLE